MKTLKIAALLMLTCQLTINAQQKIDSKTTKWELKKLKNIVICSESLVFYEKYCIFDIFHVSILILKF